jgi:hypothetical protein
MSPRAMLLFKKPFHEGLKSGAITITYRRWQKPHVKPRGRYRCHPIGVLEVDSVALVTVAAITADDAKRAGFATRDALVAYLAELGPLAAATHDSILVSVEFAGWLLRDDTGLGAVANVTLLVRFDPDRAGPALFLDRRPAVAQQRHKHPALGAVWILDHPQVLIFLDDPDRQDAPLVKPNPRIIAARSGAGHRFPGGDRGPVRRLLVLCRGGRRDGDQQERGERPSSPHHAPVRIRSTSCFTVGMKPLE